MKSKTYLLEIYSIVYMFLLSFISLFLSSVLLRSLIPVFISWSKIINVELYIILKDSFNLSIIGALLLVLFSFLKIFIQSIGEK
ncbi:Uncharacterised protein [Actinobacillus equuli]|nr:Uncharacterised protein [Actinobacillus equuli]